jgi:uncharacterized membrane protein
VDGSVESRVEQLEERVRTLEELLRVAPAPRPASPPPPWPPLPSRTPGPEPEPAPPPEWREPRDLEELLGGRVLGWLGGVAVVLAAAFFLAMAVHNGWIGETGRVVLAFAASLALLGAGIWLYERRGRLQAARAAVSASLAALYASDTAATAGYHLIGAPFGLVVAAAIGAAAVLLALRWSAVLIGGLGIVGSLLAPVLVHAGGGTTSLLFVTIALLASTAVVVFRRWRWLAVAAYLTSAPQALAWVDSNHVARPGATLAVVAAYWLVIAVAALGSDMRDPGQGSELLPAVLLVLADAAGTAAVGWWVLHDGGHGDGATTWVLGVGAVHVALAAGWLAARLDRRLGIVLAGEGSALVALGTALALRGPALVAAWTVEAAVVAGLSRRDPRVLLGAYALLALAAAHALVAEAPPRALAFGLESFGRGAGALVLVLAGLLVVGLTARAAGLRRDWDGLRLGAATFAVYLGSVVVVDAAGGHPGAVSQHAQLALSGFWTVLGLGGLLAGLARDVRSLRLGGFSLLGLAAAKVFVVDLAALESVWRVASFLALGLLLLAGAYAYQRAGRQPGSDAANTPSRRRSPSGGAARTKTGTSRPLAKEIET